MALTFLASFPNSRIKPRNAGTQFATNIVPCATGATTEVRPVDSKRVNVSLRNLDSQADCWYGYENTVTSADGFLLKSNEVVDLPAICGIYVFQNSGGVINVAYDESRG